MSLTCSYSSISTLLIKLNRHFLRFTIIVIKNLFDKLRRVLKFFFFTFSSSLLTCERWLELLINSAWGFFVTCFYVCHHKMKHDWKILLTYFFLLKYSLLRDFMSKSTKTNCCAKKSSFKLMLNFFSTWSSIYQAECHIFLSRLKHLAGK